MIHVDEINHSMSLGFARIFLERWDLPADCWDQKTNHKIIQEIGQEEFDRIQGKGLEIKDYTINALIAANVMQRTESGFLLANNFQMIVTSQIARNQFQKHDFVAVALLRTNYDEDFQLKLAWLNIYEKYELLDMPGLNHAIKEQLRNVQDV